MKQEVDNLLQSTDIFMLAMAIILGFLSFLLVNCKSSSDSLDTKKMVPETKLLGSSENDLIIKGEGLQTTISLGKDIKNLIKSNPDFGFSNIKNRRVYLQIQGVKGTTDNVLINLSVNDYHAGHFSLFGLIEDTLRKNESKGMNFSLDITDIIEKLQNENQAELNHFNLNIQPSKKIKRNANLNIQKIILVMEEEEK